ncbi:MAG: hsaA 1 [Glaciihabitans sp.]|nr:hsaA 1 [Glaciihabitans sp.]
MSLSTAIHLGDTIHAGNTGLPAAADRLGALAAEHAAAADAARRLPPEIIEGLRDAGVARHFVSTRWGGTDGTFTDFLDGVIKISAGCASTGWCASLLGASARFAAHLPEMGHEQLWASSADTFIATGLVAAGTAERVSGGYRLSGRWSYISGVEFAEWALLCGSVGESETPSGVAVTHQRFFAVHKNAYQIVESWDCAGMRATGSHNVVVTDAFVPEHMSFDRQDMVNGINTWSSQPTHNVPYQASGAFMMAAPIVGAAQGAVRAAAHALRGKRMTDAAQTEFARATARVDAAQYLVEQAAEVIDNRSFTAADMARNQRNASFAAEQATEGVAGLVRAAGTSGLSESSPLQRAWRDVTAAATHVALRYDITRAAANYSEALISGAGH